MIAFFRELAPSADQREAGVSKAPKSAIRPDRARKQHAIYVKLMRELGLEIEMLKPAANNPEAAFLGDIALLLPEVAVVPRSLMTSKLDAVEAVVTTLARYRPVQRLTESSQLDGEDVVWINHTPSSSHNQPEPMRRASLNCDRSCTLSVTKFTPWDCATDGT